MDLLIENRLKRMRRVVRMADKKNTRRISLIDWRKEKRHKLVNEYRKIDFDWFDFDLEEDIDCGHNIGDNSRCLEILFEYLCEKTLLTESVAKRCLESSKIYLKGNQITCENLIRHDFFSALNQFVSKPLISNGIKFSALDLIDEIISNINVAEAEDLICNNGLILSVMVNLNAFDIEVLTKTVVVMQGLTRDSSRLLRIAIDNGYLLFLMKIIKTTHKFRQRQSTETIKSKRLSEKKLNLIRQISESLRLVANDLSKSDVIRDLYPLFERLIQFKDKTIIFNALSSLTIVIERNPESVALLTRYLILSMTDLISKNNENISAVVVHFWKLFNRQSIGDNVVNTFKNFLIESNLIKKLYEILSKVESNRLITEVVDLLTELVDRFDNSFELMVEFDIYRSLMNALSVFDPLCRRQVLRTINRIVSRIESYHVLNHLLEIEIIESLAPLLFAEDPDSAVLSSQTLTTIMRKSERFGIRDIVIIRGQYCSLSVASFLNQNS